MDTGVGVLDKVMSILYLFRRKRQQITVQDIVESLNYSVPTTYRLINAMEKHGLVKREGEMISLGSLFMEFGMYMLGNIDICNEARPYMDQLNRETNENINLNIKNRNQRVVVQAFQSTMNVRSAINIGATYPIFSGAAGKIFLAYYSPDECRRILAETDEYAAINETNRKIFDQFSGSLESFRKVGYAVSINERREGVAAIAAPVFDYTGHLAGVLTLVAPESRMEDERLYTLTQKVKRYADLISASMGYAKEIASG